MVFQRSIVEAIERLQKSRQDTKFQKNNVRGSIEALNIFLRLHFPAHFKKLKCTFPSVSTKVYSLNGVDILISPDVIIRTTIDGRSIIGGIKFRISKGHGFESENALCAATAIRLYLEKHVALAGEVVDPSFCLSVDIFSERVVSAPANAAKYIKMLSDSCKEILRLIAA